MQDTERKISFRKEVAEDLSSPEVIDFSQEAVVGFILTPDGVFRTSSEQHESTSTILTKFSKLKYGDLLSVDFFADAITQTAIKDQNFLQYVLRAQEAGKNHIYITSPAIYNVPSASNVLLRCVAARLNVHLSAAALPTVVIAEQTRLSKSSLTYAKEGKQGRINDTTAQTTIVPEKFRNNFVIFVDDVYVTGNVATKTKHDLINDTQVAETFFLFGLKIDSGIVENSDGKIEDELNNFCVTGSLESILPVISSEFVAVQKTLLVLLCEENRPHLADFLRSSVSHHALVQIYTAAANNDWRNHWDGMFAPSIDILTHVMKEKRLLRADGSLLPHQRRLIDKTEYAETKQAQKFSLHHISHKSDVSKEFADLYSRMKYSDPVATEYIAEQLFESLWNNPNLQKNIQEDNEICISSSPYGEIPTAAANIVNHVIPMFEQKGVKVQLVKIAMAGDFGTTNYGAMTPEQRIACLNGFSMQLDEENLTKIQGKFVLVIDDLNATGFHEKLVHKVFENSGSRNHAFSYIIDFDEQLAYQEPTTEEYLNKFSVKKIEDIIPYYQSAQEQGVPLTINARTIKFLLLEAIQKPRLFQQFLETCSQETLLHIHRTTFSIDGYAQMPQFMRGAQIIENYLLGQGLLPHLETSQEKNRVVGAHISITEDGRIIDMRTSQERNDLGYAYSMMKFGSVEHINYFAEMISDTFLQRLDDPEDRLSQVFEVAQREGHHIIHVVPGSRNVESASYFVHQKALELINIELSLRNLPTIVSVKLPRLRNVPGEYAKLDQQERTSLPEESDHILPGKEFYRFPMHMVFADDVRITGATADAVKQSAAQHGILSFTEMYGLVVDSRIAHTQPQVENWLNTRAITGELNETLADLINQEGFQPVQRLLRLLLNKKNRGNLAKFVSQDIASEKLVTLYKSALVNDYLKDNDYAPSVQIIQKVLQEKQILYQNNRFFRK